MLSAIPQAKKASVKVTTEEEELKSMKSARKFQSSPEHLARVPVWAISRRNQEVCSKLFDTEKKKIFY